MQHPHTYALMAMTEKKAYTILETYKSRIDKHIEFYMQEEFVKNIAPQHLSLLYFSYPKKYPKTYVKRLEAKIKTVLKKYLPLHIKVQGLEVRDFGVPVVCWNITELGATQACREELIEALRKDIEHFNDEELEYTPHIGVAKIKEGEERNVKKILQEINEEEQELLLDQPTIFYEEGAEKIEEEIIQ